MHNFKNRNVHADTQSIEEQIDAHTYAHTMHMQTCNQLSSKPMHTHIHTYNAHADMQSIEEQADAHTYAHTMHIDACMICVDGDLCVRVQQYICSSASCVKED